MAGAGRVGYPRKRHRHRPSCWTIVAVSSKRLSERVAKTGRRSAYDMSIGFARRTTLKSKVPSQRSDDPGGIPSAALAANVCFPPFLAVLPARDATILSF